MSRIGKQPIALPSGVTVEASDAGLVTVKGARGTMTQQFSPDMKFVQQDGHLIVERPTDSDRHRALHGLTRTLLANMVTGVSTGYQKVLQVNGVGFRAQLSGKNLTLSVGYSHPVEVTPREGITFTTGVDPQSRAPLVTVSGVDKQLVGQQAAEIRKVRPPEPYKGKGIKYIDEVIRRKAGKSGKAGGKGGKK